MWPGDRGGEIPEILYDHHLLAVPMGTSKIQVVGSLLFDAGGGR